MDRNLGIGVLVALFLVSGCTLFQFSQEPDHEDVIVGKIGEEPVTQRQLVAQYNKSNPVMMETDEEQGLEDFLPLYMDYRLKLQVAQDGGYMDDPEILSELEQYQRQSAYPFWLEREVKDKLLDELYERSREQIHAQHILISLPSNATPSDTLEAYERLMEARDRFLNEGADFMDLSEQFSSRQRGQSMGGDLGYFSAGWAVKPFEDAAYSLSPGEVSMPFRTRFGYHIIHVKDRMETGPDKHFSHIFFRTRNVEQPVDSIMAAAEEAYRELEGGKPWRDVVETYSEDEQSRLSGGAIGWVDYGRFHQDFTDTLMQIEDVGAYTKPFQSPYGVQIVKLDSLKHPTEEERREELLERLNQLPRYRDNEQAVRTNIAEAGDARFHREHLETFEEYLRQAGMALSSLTIPDSLAGKPVLSFNRQSWSVADYSNWLTAEQEVGTAQAYHHSMADEFRDYVIDSRLIPFTIERFPEFSELSNDYHTGLAVFQVNEDSIWTYAQQDTARLKQLLEANDDQYQYGTRYRYVRFSAQADSTLDRVVQLTADGVPVDSIQNNLQSVVVRRDIANQLDGLPYTHLEDLEEGMFSSYFDYRNRRTAMYLEEILQARPMTFDEAYNRLVTEYQNIREMEWMESMRSKYGVEMYPEALRMKE